MAVSSLSATIAPSNELTLLVTVRSVTFSHDHVGNLPSHTHRRRIWTHSGDSNQYIAQAHKKRDLVALCHLADPHSFVRSHGLDWHAGWASCLGARFDKIGSCRHRPGLECESVDADLGAHPPPQRQLTGGDEAAGSVGWLPRGVPA
jgi:hypothetical protein